MDRLLKQFSRHYDILLMAVTSLFIAGVAWADINNKLKEHEEALNKHSQQIEQIKDDSHVTKETTVRIEQKLDDLTQWMRAKNGR